MSITHYTASRAKTDSKVGKLFNLSWQLKEHHKNMIIAAKFQTKRNNDFKAFEDFLNGIYTHQDQNLGYDTMYQAVDNAIKNFIDEQIKKVEIDQSTGLIKNLEEYKNDFHANKISLFTIEEKIKKIQQGLNINENVTKLKDMYPNLIIDINNLKMQLENIINNDPILCQAKTKEEKQKNFLFKNSGQNIAFLIDQLDSYYKLIKYVNGNRLNVVYGKAFEYSLQAYNDILNDYIDGEMESIIKDSLTKIAGSQSIKRGENESRYYKTKEKSYIQSNNELVRIRAFDKRQGKMDIEFKLPEDHAGAGIYRITAKNWKGFFNRDFGSTSLSYALARSANLDFSFAYGLTVGHYNPKGTLWPEVQAHEFAKTCILLDILMGYSQKNNYADTIVINNKLNPKRPISVFSIYEILEKISKKIKQDGNEPTQGIKYDYSGIDLTNIKNSKIWLTELQQQMKKIKVSITSDILK